MTIPSPSIQQLTGKHVGIAPEPFRAILPDSIGAMVVVRREYGFWSNDLVVKKV